MNKYIRSILALVLAGCGVDSITPKLALQMDAKRDSNGTILVSVTIQNEIDRPTVPLLVEADAVEQTGKTRPVIQPAAFVLNRREARTITARMNNKSALTLHLQVKEAERGILLKTASQTVEAAK